MQKEKGEAFTRGPCPLTNGDHTILLEVAPRQRRSPELDKFQKRISKRIVGVDRCDRVGDFIP
jgi:ribosomal protein S10